MKYVIFGHPALCWLIAYQIKFISPNICVQVVYSNKDVDKCFEINKTFIDRLRFFGTEPSDFLLGCQWVEKSYFDKTNVITMKDFLEKSDETLVLDTKKTIHYFSDRCDMLYEYWNGDNNDIIDKVYHVDKKVLDVIHFEEQPQAIDCLKLSDSIVARGEVYIDMRLND